MKATHGVPLDVSIEILTKEGYTIEWVSFIEQARKNGWWDYQTLEVVSQSLNDAGIEKSIVDGIIERFKLYVLNNPHLNM